MHVVLLVDITQVQKQEKRKLESKFKNIFLSSMSHNLKTPINSLMMNNVVIRKRVTDPIVQEIGRQDEENLTLLGFQLRDIMVRPY